MAKTYRSTIHRLLTTRVGEPPYELTTAGRNGLVHTHRSEKKGKDGHFTKEGEYRRAIEEAVRKNKGTSSNMKAGLWKRTGTGT